MGSRSRLIDIVTAGAVVVITTAFVSGLLLFTQGTLRSVLARNRTRGLGSVFADATHFSPKTGAPPHISATATDPRTGERRLLGWAFYTDELEPYTRGYDGWIRILVSLEQSRDSRDSRCRAT